MASYFYIHFYIFESKSVPWGCNNNLDQIEETRTAVQDEAASVQTYGTGESWQIGVLIIQTFHWGRAVLEGKTTSLVQLNFNGHSEAAFQSLIYSCEEVVRKEYYNSIQLQTGNLQFIQRLHSI